MNNLSILPIGSFNIQQLSDDVIIAETMKIVSETMMQLFVTGFICGLFFGGLAYFLFDRFYLKKHQITIMKKDCFKRVKK